MIDLHCHILPNIDDGPQSMEESLQMARFFVDDGIEYVVATPHCHRYVHLLRTDILPQVSRLNSELELAGIALTILPGSEIQVTDSKEYRREFKEGLYCHFGDRQSYTLLEFNWTRDRMPADAVDLVAWICAQGMKPILAHPERHDFFGKEPELLQAMVDVGAWPQITVDSLLGKHGPVPQTMGEEYLRVYREAVLATDSHNMQRCSGLSVGYDWVREHLGHDRADDLNARSERVLAGLLSPI